MLRARSARAFDNVTKAKGPCTLEKTGEQLSNFLKAIKKNNGFIFSCPSKVAQLLLSIFAMYKTRESVQKFCSQFLGLEACGNLGKFCQAQILNFLWLDFLAAGCGQIRGRKSLKIP